MKVITYISLTNKNDISNYIEQFRTMVIDYYKEVHKQDYVGSLEKVLNLVDYWATNYYIYLVVEDNKLLGFLCMSINDQVGMVKPYLVVDYMYVDTPYRGTRATQWLFLTIGKVANDLQMDVLGTTLAGSSNNSNSELMGGETIATIRLMKREDFESKYIKYSRRLNVKISQPMGW